MNNVDAKKFNLNTPPVDFLMDSEELDVTFNAANPPSNLGKVSLRRAAAKVVVDITGCEDNRIYSYGGSRDGGQLFRSNETWQ